MDIFHAIIGNYYGSDWAGMFLQCASIYLLGNQRRIGFILGIGSNAAWFVFGILTGSIADLLSQCIVIIMNIRGFSRWNSTETESIPVWLSPQALQRPFPSPLL